MKRFALLFTGLVAFTAANAQLSLSGTSYSQNFDNIASGLPTGWSVRTAASATAIGTPATLTTTATLWNTSTGNFRNVSSADGFANYAAGTSTLQGASTDRALAIRQVSNTSSTFPGTDPGGAFVLQIANTTGLTNFNLTFKLQSLDSTSRRRTTWAVDYGFGATPTTFTPATTTGTMTTGAYSFSNNTVTVNFGAALNNQAGPVWLRVVTLNMSDTVIGLTGTGNRTTTGIDDFNLTWTGTASTSYRPVITGTTPANNATNVAPGNLSVVFDRNVTGKAAGNIVVKNETDQTSQTFAGNASNVAVSGNTVTISGVTMALGKTYHVTMDSAAFDTASYKSYGIYDTTQWRFSTAAATVTVNSINEGFDAACATSSLPAGWSKQNVVGPNQQWNCYTSTGGKVCMRINGYAGGNNANEDWLITPKIDLSAGATGSLRFDEYKGFTGAELQVLVSSTYSGNGNPNATSWTNLNINMPATDTFAWHTYTANLAAYTSTPFFVAFKYTSSTSDGYDMRLDSVVVNSNPLGIFNVVKQNMDLTVVGNPTSSNIELLFDLKQAGAYNFSIYDITGREVFRQVVNGTTGTQRLTVGNLNLTSGMYIVKMNNENSYGIAKAIVQ